MYERTHRRSLLQRLIWFAALMASIAFAMIYSIPTAHADNCWGRALSEDHLNCYILEQAQKADVIDVEAVFEAGRTLHIYLDQTEPVSDEVGQFFKEKATEFIDRWPGHVYYDHPAHNKCRRILEKSRADCLLNKTTLWKGDSILPISKSYTNIVLRTGGADARMDETGWPSYRQVWPDLSPADRTQRSANGFDVSEVNTSNFPRIDCSMERLEYTTCHMALEFPSLHIAGFFSRDGGGLNSLAYVQVKTPPGGEVDVDAVKEEMISQYTSATKDNYMIIPVKYSFEELWRWEEILTRFTLSSGNTLGIIEVGIGDNNVSYAESGDTVYPLPNLQSLESGLKNGISELENDINRRTTIHMLTLNLQETVDALPQLLGQLGIPVDAVGVIIESIDKPTLPGYPAIGGLSSSIDVGVTDIDVFDITPTLWLAIGGVSALALAALGSGTFVIIRLRRNRR